MCGLLTHMARGWNGMTCGWWCRWGWISLRLQLWRGWVLVNASHTKIALSMGELICWLWVYLSRGQYWSMPVIHCSKTLAFLNFMPWCCLALPHQACQSLYYINQNYFIRLVLSELAALIKGWSCPLVGGVGGVKCLTKELERKRICHF